MSNRLFRDFAGRVRRRLSLSGVYDQFGLIHFQMWSVDRRLRRLQEALGRVEARQLAAEDPEKLQDWEFSVYSQWGEDGIIQYLCSRVPIDRKIFVEFGVEDYEEANTRFLLVNNNWSGLVIDADPDHLARIRESREYWLYNLKAVEAFVTRDNINEILAANGLTGDIGILSIDIDGMDYWIWEAIDVISPRIMVIEYNYRFGSDKAVTVPYNESFERRKAHHSILYYGASLKAMCQLAEKKGYAFVGSGSHGLNAFFVRKDVKPDSIREVSPEEGFIEGQFCEAHDQYGNRIYMSNEEQAELVQSLPLVHLD